MRQSIMTLAFALAILGCRAESSQDPFLAASPEGGSNGPCQQVIGYPLPDGGVGTSTDGGNGFYCQGIAGSPCPFGSVCTHVQTVMVDCNGKRWQISDGMGYCVDTGEGRCGQGYPECPFPFVCGAEGRCLPRCTCDWGTGSDAGAPEGQFCSGPYNPPVCYPVEPPRAACSDTERCADVGAPYICVNSECRVPCWTTETCPSGSACEYIDNGTPMGACTRTTPDAGPPDAGGV